MVAFLKKRHDQKLKSQASEEGKEMMDVSEQSHITEGVLKAKDPDGVNRDKKGNDKDSSERSLPGVWLHMDVVEKDKIEWMTDVPLYQQDPSDEQQPREIRFSLDGLVIPRNIILPVHLGLHHHGDEPQVRCALQDVYVHVHVCMLNCTIISSRRCMLL